jgi:predicted RNase H-like HicB family nuclease
MNVRYTAIFEQVGNAWMGFTEELPGANTQGETLEEARENLKEAIQLILEANRELTRRRTEGHQVRREELLVSVG